MLVVIKYNMANLSYLIALWMGFMVTQCPSAPPPYNEPLIFVTLTRWENRTFSPRLFYVTMVQQQESNLNQVQQEAYPFESPLSVPKKLDGNKLELQSLFSIRNAFNKRIKQAPSSDGSSSSTTQNTLDFPAQGQNESDPMTDELLNFNYTFDNTDRITFELPNDELPPLSQAENLGEETIVFKDNKDNRLANRRTTPGGHHRPLNQQLPSSQEDHIPTQKLSCLGQSKRNYNVYGKNPRGVLRSIIKVEPTMANQEKIPTLELALKIVKTSVKIDNLIFSPFSIANILALLLLGTSKSSPSFHEVSKLLTTETKEENVDLLDTKVHDLFSEALHTLKYCSNSDVVLEAANEIFTDTNFTLLESYESAALRDYGATVKQFDFKSDAEGFQYHVNSWVREKTKGKIQSIVDSPPSHLTTLALVNAIYFQGSWEVPFAPQITRDGVFHVENNNLTVKIMTNELKIPYLKTDAYQMIRLAYKGTDTALYIILPNNEGLYSLLELEKDLTTNELENCMNIMANSDPRMVTVKIPKMRVESDGHLKDILANLGVESIFNSSSANFSRISSEDGLYVSSLLHRAIVDINEKGTEAAAVSVATSDRNFDENPIPFTATRPFLFFIHNNIADTILFYGRVLRPQPLDESQATIS